MKKIMLILEDYNELIYTETILKKIGFDCMGMQSDAGFADKVLSFGPHAIISEGNGRKIKGTALSQKIKRMGGYPKLILVTSPFEKIEELELKKNGIEGTILRPIHPVLITDLLSSLLGLDVTAMLMKLEKLGMFQGLDKEAIQHIRNKKGQPDRTTKSNYIKSTSIDELQRESMFVKGLSELPEPTVDGLDRSLVVSQVEDFRNREDDPEIRAIDEERLKFAKALFRKT